MQHPYIHHHCRVSLRSTPLATQVIYAYFFYDASQLLMVQRFWTAYMEPIDVSLYYPQALFPGTYLPYANGLPALASLGVLGLLMKGDQEGTMLTMCPLEALFLPDPDKVDKTLCAKVCRGILAVIAQLFWTCRAMLLPVVAGMGTSSAFIASSDAQEIVLVCALSLRGIEFAHECLSLNQCATRPLLPVRGAMDRTRWRSPSSSNWTTSAIRCSSPALVGSVSSLRRLAALRRSRMVTPRHAVRSPTGA